VTKCARHVPENLRGPPPGADKQAAFWRKEKGEFKALRVLGRFTKVPF